MSRSRPRRPGAELRGHHRVQGQRSRWGLLKGFYQSMEPAAAAPQRRDVSGKAVVKTTDGNYAYFKGDTVFVVVQAAMTPRPRALGLLRNRQFRSIGDPGPAGCGILLLRPFVTETSRDDPRPERPLRDSDHRGGPHADRPRWRPRLDPSGHGGGRPSRGRGPVGHRPGASRTSSSAVPTRPARTTATSPGWPSSWPGCRSRSEG